LEPQLLDILSLGTGTIISSRISEPVGTHLFGGRFVAAHRGRTSPREGFRVTLRSLVDEKHARAEDERVGDARKSSMFLGVLAPPEDRRPITQVRRSPGVLEQL